jgi:nicotinamide mononucleotide adenylyltransferase
MYKNLLTLLFIAFSFHALSETKEKMQQALNSLVELIPIITNDEAFKSKQNEAKIQKEIDNLQKAFKQAGHERLVRQDVFAPSYTIMNEYLADAQKAFKKGNKDYANWRLKEITNTCLDCHTRMPVDHPSSFRQGQKHLNTSNITDPYNRGIVQLVVRLYPEAKATFTSLIDQKLIKNDIRDLDLPFKQLLMIQTKVLKDPEGMIKINEHYLAKKNLPEDIKKLLTLWNKDLKPWTFNRVIKNRLNNDKEVSELISKNVKPAFKEESFYSGDSEVSLLISSGLLSNYLFENTGSPLAPEIMYWLGISEKYLLRDRFFGAGDQFLKLCIRRYPKTDFAPKCLREYKESIEFEFSGSRGTDIPEDVEKELKGLEQLIKTK